MKVLKINEFNSTTDDFDLHFNREYLEDALIELEDADCKIEIKFGYYNETNINGDLDGFLYKNPSKLDSKLSCYLLIFLPEKSIDRTLFRTLMNETGIKINSSVSKITNILSKKYKVFLSPTFDINTHQYKIYLISDVNTKLLEDNNDLYDIKVKLDIRLNRMKSDFSYQTYTILSEDKELTIKSDNNAYSDRKVKSLITGIIDLDKFNIKKVEQNNQIFNIITKK